MNDRIARYNRSVVSEPRKISESHAQALESKGIALGLWDCVNYMRTKKISPADAARSLYMHNQFDL